jgi:outer membrane cobalamin receptor
VVLAAAEVEARPRRTIRLVAAAQTEVEAALERAARPSGDAMLAVRWEPRAWLDTGVTVGRRSRTPTLRERYSSTSGEGERLPNPDLRPEVAFHFGLDARFRPARTARIDLSFFDAEVQDLIDRVPLSAGLDQYQNISRARLLGAELLLALAPTRGVDVELGYQFLHARSVRPGEADGPLAYRPEHLLRLAVRVRPTEWLEIASTARLVGPEQFQDPDTARWRDLGVYVVWDGRVELRPFAGLAFWAEATNILDYDYQTEYGYPDPGFQLWAGLRLEIERRD